MILTIYNQKKQINYYKKDNKKIKNNKNNNKNNKNNHNNQNLMIKVLIVEKNRKKYMTI